MIEHYETVEGCPTIQRIQQVFVGLPALQLYCMQLCNVCASKLNSNTNFLLKKANLKLGPRSKNYRTG